MALVDKLICTWTGFAGAPGYNIWYADNGPYGVRAQIVNFYNAVKPYLPPNVHIAIPDSGETFEVETGDLQQTNWISGPAVDIVGTASTQVYTAPAGVFVEWKTQTVAPPVQAGKRPRRVHGGLYLVPVTAAAADLDGTLTAASYAAIQAAANNLTAATGGHFCVWAKPHYTNAVPPVRDRIGTRHSVVTASVKDKFAVLRRRRD